MLPDGKVLLAGGTENEPENFHVLDKAALSTELFDPDAETVSAGRRGQRGQRARRRGGITEIKGTWTLTVPLNDGHYGHTATLLPNGKVLLAGGKTGRQPMSIQKPGGQVVLEDPGMYAGAELCTIQRRESGPPRDIDRFWNPGPPDHFITRFSMKNSIMRAWLTPEWPWSGPTCTSKCLPARCNAAMNCIALELWTLLSAVP